MAARRHLGGLAAPAFPAVVLMRACFDWVLVETVGVGQSETEIADCADLVLLCVQPGSGDALQFMKAGIMEVPDLVLVTKGDLGAPARRAASDLRGALSLAAGREPPRVALVSAHTGEGLDEVVDADRRPAATAACDLADAAARPGPAPGPSARLLELFGTVGHAALAPDSTSIRTPPSRRCRGSRDAPARRFTKVLKTSESVSVSPVKRDAHVAMPIGDNPLTY